MSTGNAIIFIVAVVFASVIVRAGMILVPLAIKWASARLADWLFGNVPGGRK